MLHYLLIADVSDDMQKECYFKLAQYLKSLNTNSDVSFIRFAEENPKYYLIDFKKNEQQIDHNAFFEKKHNEIFELCKNFIFENAQNDTVFILFDSCLVNSPLNNISYNQYYTQEYTYKLYDELWTFVNSPEGDPYKSKINWCCFSRGDTLLGFMARALKDKNNKVIDNYKVKKLMWFYHIENGEESKLEFGADLEAAIGEI